MNIKQLKNIPLHSYQNNHWKNTHFYELTCKKNREFFSSIYITVVDSSKISTLEETLLYLLQRTCYEQEAWDKNQAWNLLPKQFINFILSEGYVTNISSQETDIEAFWKDYQQLLTPLLKEEDFTLMKDGILTPYTAIMEKASLAQVWSFDNQWNNKQYLIKTIDNHVLYLDWGTTV